MDVSTMLKASIAVYCLITVFIRDTQCVTVRSYCYDTPTGYRATFSLRKDGGEDNQIDGLEAYDASIDPRTDTPIAATGADCSTSITIPGHNNVYFLSFMFNSSSPACGSVGTTIQIRAKGTSQFWEVPCGGNGLPNTITDSISATGAPEFHHHLPNPFDVRFQAFEADGTNAPATSVHFGQDIKLRLIYNVGEIETGPDNWGMIFHIGFTPHPTDTELIIQIVTPGLGTKVHISGELADNVIDRWVSVKRDRAMTIKIPAAYKESNASPLDWTIKSRGIRIEAMHDRIGVRVISSSGAGSSFIVFPDDILGMEYNAISLDGNHGYNEEVLVVATADGTSVNIVYNNFPSRTGLDVNGIDADTGATTDGIMLDEYDVLHILCNGACHQIKILSDKPVGVIFGAYIQGYGLQDHVSTQLLPVVNYDDRVVVTDATYIAQHEDPTITLPVFYEDITGNSQAYNGFPVVVLNEGEHRSHIHVGLYEYSEGADHYIFPMPSVKQWGAFNYFYAKEGDTYSILVVGRIGEVANIQFKTGSVTTNLVGSTLGEQPGFSTTSINGLYQQTDIYEKYVFTVTVTDSSQYLDEGLIEFKGGNSWNTFLMIIEEQNGPDNLYLPYGVRYPPNNPCVPTSVSRPGDLINNDCDKYTDEEAQNGQDDDDDSEVDEDVAIGPGSRVTGIFVEDLYLCPDPQCSSKMNIHTSGCNDDPLGDDSHLGIGPFQHKTNLAEEFDNYYVIETSAFNAFIDDRNDNVLYFMVTYGICLGDLTRCENSCQTVAKRSTDEVRNGVTLAIPVIRNSTHATPKGARQGNVGGQRKPHPCSNNPVYWVTMSLLLCILVIEVIATVFFSYKWYQFRKLMHN